MENYKSQYKLAQELAHSGSYEQALASLDKALEATRDDRDRIESLLLKADIYRMIHNQEKTLQCYEQSLAITNSQENASIDVLKTQASIHLMTGQLYKELQMLDQAIAHLKDAYKMYHSVMGESVNSMNLAYNTFLLSQCFSIKKDIYQWRKFTRESMEILENTENNYSMLAHLYGSMAESYEEEDYTYAILYWNKSLKIYFDLCKNDDSFLPYLAAAYNNLAVNEKRNIEHHKAAQNYMKSLEIYLRLSEVNPIEYKPFVAGTYNSMAILFTEMFDKEEAHLYYQKAHTLYQELTDDYPDLFLPYLGTVKHNLGVYFDDLKEYQNALEYYEQALQIRKTLATKGIDSLIMDQAVTTLNILTIYQTQLENKVDFSISEKALSLINELKSMLNLHAIEHPLWQGISSDLSYFEGYFLNTPREDIIVAKAIKDSYLMEDQYAEKESYAEKKELLSQNILNLQSVIDQFPENPSIKERLHLALTHIGWIHLLAKQYKEAENCLQKSLTYKSDDISSLINLAHVRLLKNDFKEASVIYRKVKELASDQQFNIKEEINKDLLQFQIHTITHPDLVKIKTFF